MKDNHGADNKSKNEGKNKGNTSLLNSMLSSNDELFDSNLISPDQAEMELTYAQTELEDCLSQIKAKVAETAPEKKPALLEIVNRKVSELIEAFSFHAQPELAFRDSSKQLNIIKGVKSLQLHFSELDNVWVLTLEPEIMPSELHIDVEVAGKTMPVEMERNDSVVLIYLDTSIDLLAVNLTMETNEDRSYYYLTFSE